MSKTNIFFSGFEGTRGVKKNPNISHQSFYNQATDALLNLYSKESRAIKGSATWKSIIVYKNMLWAIDNIGVNAAWVIKYYTKGTLSNDEIVQYLRWLESY